MEELLACRVCLATDVKLHSIFHHGHKKAYENLSGLQINSTDPFPQHLCSYCSTLLAKCVSFQERILRGHELLECALLESPVLTTEYISSIDRDAHEVSLPYIIHQVPPMSIDPKFYAKTIITSKKFIPTVSKINLENLMLFKEEVNLKRKDIEETSKEEFLSQAKDDNDNDSIISKEDYKEVEYLEPSENEAEGVENGAEGFENYTESLENVAACLENEGELFEMETESPENNEEGFENDAADVEYEAEGFENEVEVFDSNVEAPENKKEEFTHFSTEDTFVLIELNKEEQMQELQDRKKSDNYRNSFVKCEICFKGYTTYATYKNHMKRHDPAWGSEVCDICHLRWRNKEGLRTHVLHSHVHKFSCTLCDFTCKTKFTAQRHHEWHNGRKYECEKCGVKFSKSTIYLSHMRLQHPSPQRCEDCGQQFISERGLTLHRSTAHIHGEYPTMHLTESIVCPICTTKFQNQEALEKHMSYIEDGVCDTKLKVCRYCGEYLLNKEKLRQHQITYHADIKCDECGKTFANEALRDGHYQRLHSDEKPYVKRSYKHTPMFCEVCGKHVSTKAQLVDHKRIHTGERPFQCPVCEKSFRLVYLLKIHIRTHTGERPFQCLMCPKAFISLAALYRHERVHTAIKPYKCSHCGNCFTQSNALKLHVLTVHMKMPDPYKRGPRRRKPKPEELNTMEITG